MSRTAEHTDQPPKKATLVKDSELQAMNAIAKAMGTLTQVERDRVVAWTWAKYGIAEPTKE